MLPNIARNFRTDEILVYLRKHKIPENSSAKHGYPGSQGSDKALNTEAMTIVNMAAIYLILSKVIDVYSRKTEFHLHFVSDP